MQYRTIFWYCINKLLFSMFDTVTKTRVVYHVLAPTYCVFQSLHSISIMHTQKHRVLHAMYCRLSIMSCGSLSSCLGSSPGMAVWRWLQLQPLLPEPLQSQSSAFWLQVAPFHLAHALLPVNTHSIIAGQKTKSKSPRASCSYRQSHGRTTAKLNV